MTLIQLTQYQNVFSCDLDKEMMFVSVILVKGQAISKDSNLPLSLYVKSPSSVNVVSPFELLSFSSFIVTRN